MNKIEIIPTYVPQGFSDLLNGVEVIRTFATSIHIDVDDGVFAPHITWPYIGHGAYTPFELSGMEDLTIEVHLMVEESRDVGVDFARAGAMRVLGHIEGFADTKEAQNALEAWKGAGASEVGLGILLHTPLPVLEPLIPLCNVVHMMSIATVGTQGIPYDASAPDRIAELHALYPELLISVDGGVSEKNIGELIRAGARRFGIGSAIMKASDPAAAFARLTDLAENAIQ